MLETVVSCPVCEAPLSLPQAPRPSQIVECGQCRSELEIVALDPLMIAVAPEVEEDWGE